MEASDIHRPGGSPESPRRVHIVVQGVARVAIRKVPGLRGLVVVPSPGTSIDVTPTSTGLRLGGRKTEHTMTADNGPVGVEVPWLDGPSEPSSLTVSIPELEFGRQIK